ncbi:MAG: amino acid permease [Steroidobacteraceae bacterium]
MNQLLATKSIAEIQETDASGHRQLNRSLSATALILLGIGGTIGTGIFVLTGTAAANYAGPALALSFIIAGIGCAFAGLCYSEFAAMIPVTGSAYSYSYATLGEGVAWFIGWNLVLEYLFAVATVSVGWSGYLVNLLDMYGIHLPYALSHAPFGQAAVDRYNVVRTGAILNVPAVVIVAVLATICYVGIKQTSAFNSIIVVIKIAVVLTFIFLGIGYIQPHNWHPFIPPNAGHWGVYGISGIFAAAGLIFFAYIGFDAISTTAQEAKNPQRDMPIGILASLVICTVLYVIVSVILTGMVSYTKLDVPAPIALALTTYEPRRWLSAMVDIGAVAGMTSVMLVQVLAQARIFLAMSQDGLLPKFFGRVHPNFRTPSVGTVLTGVAAAIIGGLLPVDILGQLVSIGTLAAFATVCIGVLVLRYKRPDLPRPFKAPWPWFTCIAGAVICLAMMVNLGVATWIRLVGWTLIGALVYLFYGHQHSKVRARNGATQPAPSATS